MTAPERDILLPERAEALLDGWPAPPRSALEWEDAANAVMARVEGVEPTGTPDDLLAAPLPQVEGEGSLLGAAALDEPGLANIARAVVEAAQTATRRDVARDVLAAAEEGRRVVPTRGDAETAALQGNLRRHDRAARASAPPGPVPAQEHRAHAVEVVARSELPAPQSRPNKERGFAAGMFGGAALALAACAALYISVRHHDAESLVASPSSEAARAAPVSVPPAPAAPAAPGAQQEPQPVMAIDQLPASPPSLDEPAPARKPSSAAPTAAKDTLAFRVKGGASPDSDEKLVLEERDDQNPTPAPAQKMAKAAPAPPPQQAEALAPQPSLGAVQGAIGAVMGGARSCLAGQDQGSKASITFGSDGRVKAVSVSGPAAGTPAEGCVRSALMAARVPPFSESSFSAALTVRPP